jgi:hypothetical protein
MVHEVPSRQRRTIRTSKPAATTPMRDCAHLDATAVPAQAIARPAAITSTRSRGRRTGARLGGVLGCLQLARLEDRDLPCVRRDRRLRVRQERESIFRPTRSGRRSSVTAPPDVEASFVSPSRIHTKLRWAAPSPAKASWTRGRSKTLGGARCCLLHRAGDQTGETLHSRWELCGEALSTSIRVEADRRASRRAGLGSGRRSTPSRSYEVRLVRRPFTKLARTLTTRRRTPTTVRMRAARGDFALCAIRLRVLTCPSVQMVRSWRSLLLSGLM